VAKQLHRALLLPHADGCDLHGPHGCVAARGCQDGQNGKVAPVSIDPTSPKLKWRAKSASRRDEGV
jgi:hypothetical protein